MRDITDEEYASNALEKYSIENLKKIFVQIDIVNSKDCKEKDIQIPDLFVIDRYDKIRSIKGSGSDSNNLYKENNAQAVKYVIFDSTGLSINDIKKIYKDEIISVKIITKKGKEIMLTYNVGEMLKDETSR
ncbi:hypothetical protein CLHUN_14330 [Ruminiclostridium hungatei]|uniref:Uncharacterized protein n=1 Tax=Ruminiclostridium hungatei TaxID=48256 RepID=A0A1V4SLX3_RUMHU|nr:hypothetical protein [Ruminiclostridium hungatei]OPX44879.1 hypothetical protein CLHUN_14330 [Ruminiclostridium hungatei]